MRVDELMKKLHVILAQNEKADELKRDPTRLAGAKEGVRAKEGDRIKLTSEEVKRVVDLMSEVRSARIDEVTQKIKEGYYDRRDVLKEVARALIDEDAGLIRPDGGE